MKITEAQLRQLIRETIAECYGWPVADEKYLYDVKHTLKMPHPKDPKNAAIKMPKGYNTLSSVNESFGSLNEMAAVASIKRILRLNTKPSPRDKMTLEEAKMQIDELLENETLLKISEELRGMSSRKASADELVRFLESKFTGVVLEAIQLGIGLATPEDAKELEFMADFGDVDMLSDEMERQYIKDPLDALKKLKIAAQKKMSVGDSWLIAIQLRTLHNVLQNISYKLAELLPGSGPIIPPLW